MTWLWGLVTGLPGLLSKGLDYYIAKANGNVQKAIALMEADKVRLMAQRDVTLAAMNSRVWWMGWALFVFPLGIYYAKVIVWDKVLGWGVTDPIDPNMWGVFLAVVGSYFGLSAIDRIAKVFRR